MNTKGGLTKRNTAVAEQKKDGSLQGLIRAMEPEIKKALPSVITPERFTRMVFTALSSKPFSPLIQIQLLPKMQS